MALNYRAENVMVQAHGKAEVATSGLYQSSLGTYQEDNTCSLTCPGLRHEWWRYQRSSSHPWALLADSTANIEKRGLWGEKSVKGSKRINRRTGNKGRTERKKGTPSRKLQNHRVNRDNYECFTSVKSTGDFTSFCSHFIEGETEA